MAMDRESRVAIVEKYKYEVEHLSRYIPWLQKQKADYVVQMYKGEGACFSFPVYDSTLLSFVNEIGVSCFMQRNYQYVYTKNRIRDYKDEWSVIDRTTIMTMDNISAILSKYVLGGMTKGRMWKDGIEYEIFLRCLVKAKEIIEFWDKPVGEPAEYRGTNVEVAIESEFEAETVNEYPETTNLEFENDYQETIEPEVEIEYEIEGDAVQEIVTQQEMPSSDEYQGADYDEPTDEEIAAIFGSM